MFKFERLSIWITPINVANNEQILFQFIVIQYFRQKNHSDNKECKVVPKLIRLAERVIWGFTSVKPTSPKSMWSPNGLFWKDRKNKFGQFSNLTLWQIKFVWWFKKKQILNFFLGNLIMTITNSFGHFLKIYFYLFVLPKFAKKSLHRSVILLLTPFLSFVIQYFISTPTFLLI